MYDPGIAMLLAVNASSRVWDEQWLTKDTAGLGVPRVVDKA